LEACRKQKEHFEKALALLKKQEQEWHIQRDQLLHDNNNFKETLSKLHKLSEEIPRLQNQLKESEQVIATCIHY
jgi:septal ring factor EnvC (AmiA/AmiB activator)